MTISDAGTATATALMHDSIGRQTACLGALMKAGADTNTTDAGDTAVVFAIGWMVNDWELTHWLTNADIADC